MPWKQALYRFSLLMGRTWQQPSEWWLQCSLVYCTFRFLQVSIKTRLHVISLDLFCSPYIFIYSGANKQCSYAYLCVFYFHFFLFCLYTLFILSLYFILYTKYTLYFDCLPLVPKDCDQLFEGICGSGYI